jgi:hypothetical protein
MPYWLIAIAASASACGASAQAPVPCTISLTGAVTTTYSCVVKTENAVVNLGNTDPDGFNFPVIQIDVDLDSTTPGVQLTSSLTLNGGRLTVGTTQHTGVSLTLPGSLGSFTISPSGAAFTVSDVGPASDNSGPWMHFHGSIDAVMTSLNPGTGTLTLNASF